MEYSHAPRLAENRQVLYLDPCSVFTLSLEITSLDIFFIGRSPLVQCSLAVRFFASELRNARPFWCLLFVWLVFQQCSDPTCPLSVSFQMSSSGYSFNTLEYSVGSLLVLSWRWLSRIRTRILHERSLLPKFCGLSAVRMMWSDAKTRRAAPSLLTKAKSAHKPSKLTRIHSRTHPLASKMLTLQYLSYCTAKKSITAGGKLVLPW